MVLGYDYYISFTLERFKIFYPVTKLKTTKKIFFYISSISLSLAPLPNTVNQFYYPILTTSNGVEPLLTYYK
jgi:hypothetical protein